MYIGNNEIEKIEGESITFKDGTTKTYSVQEQSYLVTEEEGDVALQTEKAMIQQLYSVLANADILKTFSEEATVRDENNVQIVAQVIKKMEEYNFPISKLSAILGYVKQFIGMIENLSQNNLKSIEDGIFVKMLGIEDKGETNNERIRNITIQDYARFSKT